MVAANPRLLQLVRCLAARDELKTMRLRGRLVVADTPPQPTAPAGASSLPPPSVRAR